MSEKVDISLVGPGIHPEYWMEIYDKLSKENEASFEMIFIGFNRPSFELPPNFKYYYSEVKMPQCLEAGMRLANGEYVLATGDDFIHCEGFLDKLLCHASKNDMDKTIIIPRAARRWKAKVRSLYHRKNKKYPIVGLAGLMKKDVYMSLGGIDKRFIAVAWHEDLHLRFYERGGSPVVANDCIWNEEDRGSYLTESYSDIDNDLLISLWSDSNKNFVATRSDELQPFESQDILKITQGSKGKW